MADTVSDLVDFDIFIGGDGDHRTETMKDKQEDMVQVQKDASS